MKNVIIFGAGGFVGRYLISELMGNGYFVYATDISDKNMQIEKSGFSFKIVDLMSEDQVFSIISETNPDYIINLAAVSSVGASWHFPQTTMGVNVIGALNILEAIRKIGIKTKILLVGSSEEYAVSNDRIKESNAIKANNPYGISKVTIEYFAELYRKEFGLNIISTRTFNHTGVGQSDSFVIPSFVKQVAKIHMSGEDGNIFTGNINVMRDIGHVKDMARAYRFLLESDTKEQVFNVGNGNTYSLRDLLNYIISLTPQKISIINDPKLFRPIDNQLIWCDNTLICRETGWRPLYTVYDAIDEMFASFTEIRTADV